MSSFVACPVCGQLVSPLLINTHLDSSCQLAPEAPRKPARKAQGGTDWLSDKRQKGAPPPVALARATDGSTVPLQAGQLRELTPTSVLLGALPPALATACLQFLLQDSPGWERGSWFLFGQDHPAPRTSRYYQLGCEGEGQAAEEGAEAPPAARDTAEVVAAKPAPACLREAARLVAAAVQQQQRTDAAAGLCFRQPDAAAPPWEPSYVLGNRYADGQESTGSHSDRLTHLGKLPTIASLNLGATRTFRLTRIAAKQAAKQGPAKLPVKSRPPGGAPLRRPRRGLARGEVASVDIPVPHNSLIVMWPPSQEAWKHEVPRCARVERHPLAGSARFNLTFRRLDARYSAAAPQCRCGREAILRSRLQAGPREDAFAYYYACDNTRGSDCRFYQPL